jgi:hypothetical protein
MTPVLFKIRNRVGQKPESQPFPGCLQKDGEWVCSVEALASYLTTLCREYEVSFRQGGPGQLGLINLIKLE